MSDSVVVDDMRIPDERVAWSLIAETLAKPHLQRSEVEVSRCMTLFKQLRAIADVEAMRHATTLTTSSVTAAGTAGGGALATSSSAVPSSVAIGGSLSTMPMGGGGVAAGSSVSVAPIAAAASPLNAATTASNFAARLQLVKAARYIQVAAGVVLLKKGSEGEPETVIELEKPNNSVNNSSNNTYGGGGGGQAGRVPSLPNGASSSARIGGGGAMGGSSANAYLNGSNTAASGRRSFVPQPPPISGGGGGGGDGFHRSGGSITMASSVAMVGAVELIDGISGGAGGIDYYNSSSDGGASAAAIDQRMFYIIVRGEVALERPTVNGRVRTEVPVGEGLGNTLVSNALPSGSFYLSLSETHMLAFPWRVYEQFLKDFDECEIKKRVRFFREGVIVPVFTPFAESRFRWFARCCYQIHLQSKEIAVREGDISDAVYFIVSGKMKVIREIDLATGGGGGGSSSEVASHTPSPFNATGGGAAAVTSNLKLLDLATLEPGEYFGELGILRHCVDEHTVTALKELLTITSDDIAGIDKEREITRIEPSIPSIPRQATVYADTPATLLVIPRLRFIELVQLGALVRFREYAKGYPSAGAIRAHFLKEHKWNTFKTRVYEEDYKR